MAASLGRRPRVPYMSGLWIYPERFGVETGASTVPVSIGSIWSSAAPSGSIALALEKGAATMEPLFAVLVGRAFSPWPFTCSVQAHHSASRMRRAILACPLIADIFTAGPGDRGEGSRSSRGRRCG